MIVDRKILRPPLHTRSYLTKTGVLYPDDVAEDDVGEVAGLLTITGSGVELGSWLNSDSEDTRAKGLTQEESWA